MTRWDFFTCDKIETEKRVKKLEKKIYIRGAIVRFVTIICLLFVFFYFVPDNFNKGVKGMLIYIGALIGIFIISDFVRVLSLPRDIENHLVEVIQKKHKK